MTSTTVASSLRPLKRSLLKSRFDPVWEETESSFATGKRGRLAVRRVVSAHWGDQTAAQRLR